MAKSIVSISPRDLGAAHNPFPLSGFRLDVGGEFSRSARHRTKAERGQTFLHIGQRHDASHLRLEQVDDALARLREVGRSEQDRRAFGIRDRNATVSRPHETRRADESSLRSDRARSSGNCRLARHCLAWRSCDAVIPLARANGFGCSYADLANISADGLAGDGKLRAVGALGSASTTSADRASVAMASAPEIVFIEIICSFCSLVRMPTRLGFARSG